MTYQILARKWRPKTFNDVVGQDHILTTIKNSFILNKIHHAYIFFGTRGVGKTTIARLFAKSLHCQIKTIPFSCGECSTCLEIEQGCFLDVIEIDAASRTKIEDTREFLDEIYYAPNNGLVKVYLIDEVHMLSKNSLNALLKTLEEPPQHVKFFLITTEQKKLPPTILSRCVQFNLRPLSQLQIFDQLSYIFQEEKIQADPPAIQLIARFAKGSMRDALSLSEQAMILGNNKISCDIIENMLGVLDTEHGLCLLEHLMHSDIHSVMSRINQCAKLNVNWDYLLSDILFLLRRIAIIQCSSQEENIDLESSGVIQSRLNILSNKISPENIQLYYQILLLGRKELPYAPSYRIGFEMLMMRVTTLLHNTKDTNETLIKKNITQNEHIINIITNQGSFIPCYSKKKIYDQ